MTIIQRSHESHVTESHVTEKERLAQALQPVQQPQLYSAQSPTLPDWKV